MTLGPNLNLSELMAQLLFSTLPNSIPVMLVTLQGESRQTLWTPIAH